MQKTLGSFFVFLSSFFFYMSTVSIRWARQEVVIHPAFFVFARFLLGTLVFSGIFLIKRKRIRPVHKGYLAGRAIFNTIAVLMFFKAVHATSSSEANILNMTYPLFIAIISWIFLKKERNLHSYLIVFLAFIGIFLIVNPFSIHASLQSLWGLGSGIVAAIAIIFLNLSRQYDDSDTILFFLFSSGTFFIFLLYFSVFHIPSGKELYYLGLCAINGILGQYLLTLGFRYITAIEGGIISSTRIILAAFLGPIIAQDPPSTIAGVIGAILIFLTNIYLITRKK